MRGDTRLANLDDTAKTRTNLYQRDNDQQERKRRAKLKATRAIRKA